MAYEFSDIEEKLINEVDKLGFENDVCIGVIAGAIISGTVEETIDFIRSEENITEEMLMGFVMSDMPE